MSLLVAAKVKGEGLTTALQALSLVWPHRDARRVLAELNPQGGDLALRYRLLEPPNLVTLASAPDSEMTAGQLPQFFQRVGEVSLLLAPPSADQAQAALSRRWTSLPRELAAMAGTDVLVDAGTLASPAQGNVEVLGCADVGMIVLRPTLDAVVHLLRRLPTLPRPRGGLVVLVVGNGPITPSQIADDTGLGVVGDLPWDSEAAAMLMSGTWSQRALRHSRLLRWSLNVAETLCALLDQVPPAPSEPARPSDTVAAEDEPMAAAYPGRRAVMR